MKAKLILQNGEVFIGKTLGYVTDSTVAELIFNTSMSGFQEIITDPSYHGQMVTMTYPLVGNYGFNADDIQSDSPKVSAFIVREDCKFPSNFRCEMTLRNYLRQYKIPGLKGVDTRALTRIIRENPGMTAILTTQDLPQQQIRKLHASYSNDNAVSMVSCKESYDYTPITENTKYKIAIIDYGIKKTVLDGFAYLNCAIRVYPYTTTAEEISGWNPDMILLSDGPGDPTVLFQELGFLQPFIGKKPLTGISLGHQLLALALGGKTSRLGCGHRGSNHPVLDIVNDSILITSQNHGYYVSTLPQEVVETHKNLVDQTNEGMMSDTLWIKSVQFQPESGPTPKDGKKLFKEYLAFVDQCTTQGGR